MIRHKRTIEQKFKAIVAMIVAMGLVSGFTLQDGTISDAWSAPDFPEHTTHTCTGDITEAYNGYDSDSDSSEHWETCSVCGAKSTHHALNFTSHYVHHTDGLDYQICDYCGWYDTSVSGIACMYRYSCDPVEDNDGNPTTHTLICTQCGVDGGSAPHNTPSPTSIEGECHEYTCSDCGYNYSAPCDPTYQMKDATHHSVRCIACGRDDTVECDYDDDGFCKDCESEAIRRLDAAKSAVKELYDTAKTKYNWLDEYGNPGKEDEARLWLQNLSQADFEALFEKKQGFDTKYYELFGITNAETLDKVLEKMEEYMMDTIPSVYTLTELVEPGNRSTYPTPQPVTINIFEKDTSNPVDAVLEITGTGGAPFTCDLKNGYTISLVSGSTSTLTQGSPTTLTLANDTYTITNKTTANGYKPFKSDNYKFTTDYSTSPYFSGLTTAPKDWVLKSPSAEVLNIYIEPLPEVKVELVKSDAPGISLTSGASIKLMNGTTTVEYNYGDKIVVGTPDGPDQISKDVVNKVITIAAASDITILEGTTPSGYEWGTGDSIFQASTAEPPVLTMSGDSSRHSVNGNTLNITFNKVAPTEITIKQFKKSTTDAIATGSLKITDTDSETWKPGDKIIVGEPADSKKISKSGDTITVKAGETYTVESDVAPLGFKKFTSHTFKVNSDGKAITMTSVPDVFEADGDKGMKVYYEAGTDINLKASGNGKPDSYKYVIKDALGNVVTVDKDTGKYPLGEGTYTLSATAAKAGYKVPSGTFKVKSDGKLDTAVTGDVSVDTGTTTVTLKYSDDKDIDDVDFVKYPKKEKKDEPDTDKDKLTGWAYKLERYTGSKNDPTDDDDDDNWTDVATVKPSSTTGTKYTLDGEKIYTNTVYRLKETTAPSGYEKDSKYVYIKFDENGDPSLVSGKAAVDDNEVQLYDVPEDEDSDDVIAIHKVNNTGTNLSGAHLQIYLYSDSNTLVYGSSSSSTSSSTSNTSSSTNSSTSSSTNSSTNRSTSSSTTKAKTTPAKPSVATNDVKFDWTTTDKAKVIDIGDLEKGKNYTLREVSAPSGYETPAYDFVFKYGTDGKLTIVRNYNGLLSVTGNKLVLKNLTPTEAAATRPKTGDHSKLALWLDICIVMLGGLYLSGYSIFESFTEKKKVKVVAKKKPHNRRKR